MKIRKLERTATVCWSPNQEPLLAVGSVAGALDASFSSKTELEIFALGLGQNGKMKKVGGVVGNARYNRLSWGAENYLASGKENGELELWKFESILQGKDAFMRKSPHNGPIRGLHFNPLERNLLASGGTDGEIWIWDLNDLSKPYAPGAKSQRLEDITALQWNMQVPHILGTASNNGYTVIWDLRNRKELLKLPYPGGRRPITCISWNPDQPTQMATASDDDGNPMIYMWDLRNASAPEKTLAGHTKGILSLDWCPKDSDLLLSCGKDNRTIVWNAQSCEPIGDLCHSANWAFDVKWCPRNPDLTAVASFDGTVTVHSLQSSSETVDDAFSPIPAHQEIVSDPNDPFAGVTQPSMLHHKDESNFCLPFAPKWLKRPCGATWNSSGQLVNFSQKNVSIYTISTDSVFSNRVDHLEASLAAEMHDINSYCKKMAQNAKSEQDRDVWLFMGTTFSEDSGGDILKFVGFDGSLHGDATVVKLLEKANSEPRTREKFSLFSSVKSEEADIDNLITKAIIVGDFDLAVNICLGANRMADALVLAYNGGEELWQRAQHEYFLRGSKSYTRVLQSVVEQDLKDIVQNCKIEQKNGWKEILGLICSYADPQEFPELFGILGSRLKTEKSSSHAASLCFIGSGEFDKVVGMWMQHIRKADRNIALQEFVEKVSILKAAIGFEDPELAHTLQEGEEYTLKDLYSLYAEYAEISEGQGKLDATWRILEMIPPGFQYPALDILRDRVYQQLHVPMSVTQNYPPFPFDTVDVRPEYTETKLMPKVDRHSSLAPSQSNSFLGTPGPSFNAAGNQANQYLSAGHYKPQVNPYPAPAPAPYAQPQISNNYFAPPQFNAPPQVNQFSPQQPMQVAPPPLAPPVSNVSAPLNRTSPRHSFSKAPPVNAMNISPIQNSGFNSVAPPQVSATTGHGHPIAETYQPPIYSLPTNSAPQPISSMAAPMPPPLTSPKLEKPERDVSKFNAAQKNIYDNLTKLWNELIADAPATDKKMIEDGEKRLELLYDQMIRQETPVHVLDDLSRFISHVSKKDFQPCHKISFDLMTKHFSISGQWIVGIKRIIELAEKREKPRSNSIPSSVSPGMAPPASGPQVGPRPSLPGPPPIGPPPILQTQSPPVAHPQFSQQPPPMMPFGRPQNPPAHPGGAVSQAPPIGRPPIGNQTGPTANAPNIRPQTSNLAAFSTPPPIGGPPVGNQTVQNGPPPIVNQQIPSRPPAIPQVHAQIRPTQTPNRSPSLSNSQPQFGAPPVHQHQQTPNHPPTQVRPPPVTQHQIARPAPGPGANTQPPPPTGQFGQFRPPVNSTMPQRAPETPPAFPNSQIMDAMNPKQVRPPNPGSQPVAYNPNTNGVGTRPPMQQPRSNVNPQQQLHPGRPPIIQRPPMNPRPPQ